MLSSNSLSGNLQIQIQYEKWPVLYRPFFVSINRERTRCVGLLVTLVKALVSNSFSKGSLALNTVAMTLQELSVSIPSISILCSTKKLVASL